MTPQAAVASPAALPMAPALAGPAGLIEALGSETKLLRELIEVLRRQRAGVAADDIQVVDDSVHAAHRVLHTLSEARRRRRTLNRLLAGQEEIPLRDLASALGALATDGVVSAADELQDVAQILSRELSINRRVLQQALDSGQEYVEALCGMSDKPLAYDRGAKAVDEPRTHGRLINQQV